MGPFPDLAILYQTHGLWSGLVGLVLAPITFVVVPWYAGIVLDNWMPFVVGYGSAVIGIFFVRLGSKASKGRT